MAIGNIFAMLLAFVGIVGIIVFFIGLIMWMIISMRMKKIQKNIPTKFKKEVKENGKQNSGLERIRIGESGTETDVKPDSVRESFIESKNFQRVSSDGDSTNKTRHKSNRFNPI